MILSEQEKKKNSVVELEYEGQNHRNEEKDFLLSPEERFMPISVFGVELDGCLFMGSGAEGEGNSCF